MSGNRTPLALDATFARELPALCRPWQPAPSSEPRLLFANDDLAERLGLDPTWLQSAEGLAVLAGNAVPEGASPIAQAYAGHQFGGYSPRLGDGRALLLGELTDAEGVRRDIHLKGSGRTPFARGGDGKAAVGPMLREAIIGEAMHALGIPTTRALAVVATGDDVARETMLPGAILTRVAASHLRVGSFQYAAALDDPDVLPALVRYAIERHMPEATEASTPALALVDHVVANQAELIAQWMLVGFIHGVMNTDNMTISGETIDYGPCAFMDVHDPSTVFSSIDHGGRYAYGNQPLVAQWNLARLAESLVPLAGDDIPSAVEALTEILRSFTDRYDTAWRRGMRAKLGLRDEQADDASLFGDLTAILHAQHIDHTIGFRSLSSMLRDQPDRARDLYPDRDAFDAWTSRWLARLDAEGRGRSEVANSMDAANPAYIPRNHLVEEALAAATAGDLDPMHRLLDALAQPFTERPGLERYAEPSLDTSGRYQTFCGT
ncbi:MAG: protein adenylyltransferase SelO [Ilumatobacteraceae bacterium]